MRILILCFIFFAQNIFAQNDTIWYNNNWEKTNKISAAFFRPTPKKLANGKYEKYELQKNEIRFFYNWLHKNSIPCQKVYFKLVKYVKTTKNL